MEGTNLDCEQLKCCKLPHIKVWSQTKYARSHVSPTLISVRDLLHPQPPARIADTIADTHIPTAAPNIAAAKTIIDMSRFVVVPSKTLTVVPKASNHSTLLRAQ